MQSTNGMRVEEVQVTPALAGEWLTRNQHNRFPTEGRVRRYAQDMAAGLWQFTHEPIAFDENDDLLDGAQRLLSIQRSNTTQRFLVVWGAPRSSFPIINTGKSRSLGDALAIRGEVNSRRMGSGVNLHWRITEGRDSQGNPASSSPNPAIGLNHFDGLGAELFRDALQQGTHLYNFLRGPLSAYAGIYPVLAEMDLEEADWFYDHLSHGHIEKETHPVLVLRNTLIHHVRDVPVTYDRMYLTALIIKGWNHFRDGDEIDRILFRRGGKAPEQFPYPK